MPEFTIVDLASQLKIKPKRVVHCLQVPLGKKVAKGDLLALKKGPLGRKRKVVAPVAGVLEKIEEESGKLFIKTGEEKKEEKLKTRARGIKGIFGFGKSQAKLAFLGEKLSLKDLKEELKGQIVAGGKIDSIGVVFKAAALEIAGLVVMNLEKEWALALEKMKDESDFSFLALSFEEAKDLKKIKKLNGKKILCRGERRELIVI